MTLSSMVTRLKTGSCLGVLPLSVKNKGRAGKSLEQDPATTTSYFQDHFHPQTKHGMPGLALKRKACSGKANVFMGEHPIGNLLPPFFLNLVLQFCLALAPHEPAVGCTAASASAAHCSTEGVTLRCLFAPLGLAHHRAELQPPVCINPTGLA